MSTIFYLIIGIFVMHPSTGEINLAITKVEEPFKTKEACEKGGLAAAHVIYVKTQAHAITHCHEEMPGQPT